MSTSVSNSVYFRIPQVQNQPSKPVSNPVQQKEPDTKISKTAIGIGVGAVLVGGIIMAGMIAKGNFSGAKRLAENIDFKKAETIEDAIKFGKEHLGIKNYSGFEAADLDVLNWVNEGLTNVSNTMKGKAKLPRKIKYCEIDTEGAMAGVRSNTLHINKKFYGNLDTMVQQLLEHLEEVGLSVDKNSVPAYLYAPDMNPLKTFCRNMSKAKNGQLLSFDEKLRFIESSNSVIDSARGVYLAPDITIKRLLSTPGVKEALEKKGITTDMSAIGEMAQKEKLNFINNIFNTCGSEQPIGIIPPSLSKFQTIYHECGHLMDNNVRNHTFAAYHNFKLPEFANALDEWVTNPEIMQAAGSVSDYARSDAAEFIAETFARLCDKEKVTDEAMALYKKLGGPMPG